MAHAMGHTLGMSCTPVDCCEPPQNVLMDSIKKNTVAATIAMEMIQKEMATASLGFRKPFKAGSGVYMATGSILDIVRASRKTEP